MLQIYRRKWSIYRESRDAVAAAAAAWRRGKRWQADEPLMMIIREERFDIMTLSTLQALIFNRGLFHVDLYLIERFAQIDCHTEAMVFIFRI